MDDGLAGNHIRALHCDKDDMLWVGTADGGVTRLLTSDPDAGEQSQSFVTFTTDDGLASNTVQAIHRSLDGALWFATGWDVSRYEQRRFLTLTTQDRLAHNQVRAVECDAHGKLWIGTAKGLSQYDGKATTNFTMNDGLPDNSIRGLYWDADGVLWLGTAAGVSRYDGQSFRNLTQDDGMVSNDVFTVYHDLAGVLWVGTPTGLSYCHTEHLVMTQGCPDQEPAERPGPSGRFLTFTTSHGLPSNDIRAIDCDAEGMLWFGTWGGLARSADRNMSPS